MIGLDGATFTLLRPLAEGGHLPFLKSLMENGTVANLMSTRNPLTPPAWTSMITGVSPESHGIYDFLRPAFLDDGSVYMNVNDRRDNHAESVFAMVSRQGMRASAFNVFGLYPPPKDVVGHTAAGFVPWKHLRGAMSEGLFDKLKASNEYDWRHLAMDHSEEKKVVSGVTDDERDGWINLQNARDAAWTTVTCNMMNEDPTELTFVVLDGPDKIQHLFWRYMDPECYAGEPGEDTDKITAACIDFYERMDKNIQRMVEAAGPETNIIITSDHGFGPTTEVVYVNEWLARRGYLKWSDSAEADTGNKLTPDKLRDHLNMVDWRKTAAFAPTPSSNGIFLKPDVGNGIGVTPDNYLETVLKLRDELLAWKDPKTGTQVFVKAECNKLRGVPFVEPCPDITLTLRDGGFVSILNAEEIVVQRALAEGTHRPAGIFVGYGPDFKKGQEVDALNLLDITPLMLTLLGLPVPRNLEGRVPTEALSDGVEAETGAATHAPGGDAGSADDQPSDEEREALLNQMKLLGYMD
ncbi:type I phosphodiesterase/nucleotide pyrophosphatase [Stappia sp. 22II-S9-Z10]|nr:type I phosphodiesterase/nucleotide pyrophosphatase [Stappia sp. 22II-S9-Z10]